MSGEPTHPWRLATNERYREVVRIIIGLATGSLVVPVFLVRDIFGVDSKTSLLFVLDGCVYASWAFLGLAIFSGIVFHYFSAKWVRMAWNQPVGIFRIELSEKRIEQIMDWTFWITVIGFMLGVGLIIGFFVSYVPAP